MDGSVWVILPTYDEAENLEAVVGGVRAAAPDGARCSSSTTTRATARRSWPTRWRPRTRRVEVLHRPGKAGLGRAYTAGFAHALAAGAGLRGRDGRRPLARPGRPAAADRAGAGGRRPRARLALRGRRRDRELGAASGGCSRAGAAATRGACSASTCATSPAASSASAPARCAAIDFESAGAQGYAFQVELTWRVLCSGCSVVEVPIRFRERRLGESKMSARIALEAAWRVPALRFGPRRWRPLEADGRPADAVVHEG